VIAACGPWQRVGTKQPEAKAIPTLTQLFDASAIYRGMGFAVGGPELPFVASLHVLAGATADSTSCVFAMSLANHALSFRHIEWLRCGVPRRLVVRADSSRSDADQTARAPFNECCG
jgi:hypothetical protein